MAAEIVNMAATARTGAADTVADGSALPARPRRRTQQERSADARARLLQAATGLICERGFALTTMAEIARAAGMTRGAIQHHFSGRDDLVLAILHDLERRIVLAFEAVGPKRRTGTAERIDHLIDALGEIANSDAYLAVVDVWVSTRADAALRDAVRASLARSTASYRLAWQRVLQDQLPAAVYAQVLRLVVTVMRGMVISRVFAVDPASSRATLAVTKEMVKLYVENAARKAGGCAA